MGWLYKQLQRMASARVASLLRWRAVDGVCLLDASGLAQGLRVAGGENGSVKPLGACLEGLGAVCQGLCLDLRCGAPAGAKSRGDVLPGQQLGLWRGAGCCCWGCVDVRPAGVAPGQCRKHQYHRGRARDACQMLLYNANNHIRTEDGSNRVSVSGT